jgi:hypothetical protein
MNKWMAVGLLCGCPQKEPEPEPPDEADTDADSDADSDADTDSDTDTDTDTGTDTQVQGSLRVIQLAETTGEDGLATFELEVLPGETALLFTGFAETRLLSVEDLEGPAGDQLVTWLDWDGDYSLTDAFWPWYLDVAFNWPVREQDPALEPGTYLLRIAAGNYIPDVPIEATVQLKSDPDFATGEVRVRIVYAEGVDLEPEVVAAVEEGVIRWKEVWAPYGLTLSETYESSTADARLQYPDTDNDDLLAVSQGGDGEQLVLLVGESFSDRWTYGYAGGIPGPLLPSGRGGVEIAWLAHAGQDALFDEDETRLMGETMAHEIGHYLGLYHPVEDGFYWWDSLDDTVECTSWQTCEAQLGENLMYPYSICDASGCLDTYLLTPGQVGVAHRFVGVLGL